MLKLKFGFIRGIEIPDEVSLVNPEAVVDYLKNHFIEAEESNEIIRYIIEEIIEPDNLPKEIDEIINREI